MDENQIAKAAEILASVQFPPQPKIVFMIHEEARKRDSNFTVISDLLGRDIALSARVIKLVNSPLFQLGHKVTSIKQALTILGLDSFNKFVITTALQEVQRNRFSADPRILEHGMVAGFIAKSVAERCTFSSATKINPDIAYLSGLFHDCAIPMLTVKFSEYGSIVESELGQHDSITVLEEKRVGTHHAIVGRMIAKTWILPELISNAILYHHDAEFTESLEDLDSIRLTAITQLADYLANKFAYNRGQIAGFNMKQWSIADWDKANENVLFELGMDTDEVKDLENASNAILSDMLWE